MNTDTEAQALKIVTAAMLEAERVELGSKVCPVFVGWDEYGTRYRLFVAQLGAAFSPLVRQEVGINEHSALVTLWVGERGVSAFFQVGGGYLADDYVSKKLGIIGEDLAAVVPKLRAVLIRSK